VRASFVILALLVGIAHADQDLAEARRLQAALDYEGALAVVDKAIAHGGADPDRLAELHLLGGELAAGLDHPDVATDHFARLLALKPGVRLPDGTSPKITEPFDAARGKNVPPLHVTPTYIHGVVTIVADADPLHLVRGMEVHIINQLGAADEVSEPSSLRIVLPTGARATEVHALDEYGNRVWLGAISEPPPVPVTVKWYDNWKTYAIAGIVATAFGLYAWQKLSNDQDAWDALREDDGQHDFTELDKLRANGDKWALAANISFGLAAALAITTAVEAIRHRPRPDDRVGLRLTSGPGSVGLGIAGGF